MTKRHTDQTSPAVAHQSGTDSDHRSSGDRQSERGDQMQPAGLIPSREDSLPVREGIRPWLIDAPIMSPTERLPHQSTMITTRVARKN